MQAEDQEALEYVGFWARVWASIIDTVLSAVLLVPLMRFIDPHGFSWSMDDYLNDARGHSLGYYLVNYVVPAVIVIVFWLTKQATPGKMAIGAKVVDARTGGPMSLGQSIGRYLGYFVSLFGLCLGFLWVAFDSRKQGWHDKLAGTVVVRARVRGPEPVRFDKT